MFNALRSTSERNKLFKFFILLENWSLAVFFVKTIPWRRRTWISSHKLGYDHCYDYNNYTVKELRFSIHKNQNRSGFFVTWKFDKWEHFFISLSNLLSYRGSIRVPRERKIVNYDRRLIGPEKSSPTGISVLYSSWPFFTSYFRGVEMNFSSISYLRFHLSRVSRSRDILVSHLFFFFKLLCSDEKSTRSARARRCENNENH